MIWLSNRLAAYFVKHGARKEEEEIYAYGLIIILSTLFELAVTYILALFLGKVSEATWFLAAFIPLRRCTGGYHSKTPEGCLILTVVCSFAGVYLGEWLQSMEEWIAVVVLFITVAVVFALAPVTNENKPLKQEEIPKFRKLARAMSVAFLFIAGILWYEFHIRGAFPFAMGMGVTAAALVIGRLERRGEHEKVLG